MLKRMTRPYAMLAVVAVVAGLLPMGGMVASADEAGKADHKTPRSPPSVDMASIEMQIVQAKAALRLTPSQERHWPRVAAAIRSIGRQRIRAGLESLSEPARRGVALQSSQTAGAARVLAAAAPLIKTLDAEQRQAALSLVRSMGYGHLAPRLDSRGE